MNRSMSKISRAVVISLFGLSILLAAFVWVRAVSSSAGDSAGLMPIHVEAVNVEIGVGSPIPVDVVVSGTWPELCAQIAEVKQSFDGSRIEISLLATAADPGCPPDHLGLPFRIAIPLNMVEKEVGLYSVTVNGVSAGFEWDPAKAPSLMP